MTSSRHERIIAYVTFPGIFITMIPVTILLSCLFGDKGLAIAVTLYIVLFVSGFIHAIATSGKRTKSHQQYHGDQDGN